MRALYQVVVNLNMYMPVVRPYTSVRHDCKMSKVMDSTLASLQNSKEPITQKQLQELSNLGKQKRLDECVEHLRKQILENAARGNKNLSYNASLAKNKFMFDNWEYISKRLKEQFPDVQFGVMKKEEPLECCIIS